MRSVAERPVCKNNTTTSPEVPTAPNRSRVVHAEKSSSQVARDNALRKSAASSMQTGAGGRVSV